MSDREDLRQRFEKEAGTVRTLLVSYCRHLVWRREDLADAVQNVLLTAYRRFGDFERGTNFKAWIFRIATYEIANLNRRWERERKMFAPWDDSQVELVEELERETRYDALLRDPVALRRAMDAEVLSALSRLSPMEHTVLLLRVIGGFDTAETAHMLEMPAGSVMACLGRGRRKLRLRLAEYARERGLLRSKGATTR